ncbi:MAG TPA: L,D-transpeptidase [Verrucomicrobiae bacterium]|nr:L,D-transpeptidase [Verrucomicrobiae bacterium]
MVIRSEEQIKKLARLTSVMLVATAEALAADNGSRPERKIVVSLADRKLAVVEAGRVVKIFSVAVGAPQSPSPAGSYEIINRLSEPTYYGFGKVIPPGKSNPVGPRWIGLSLKGFGIHGTNEPNSIGHNASHGCIRLRNQEIVELFEMVSVGDTVELFADHTSDLDAIFGPAKPAPSVVALATAAPASAVVENR